MGNNSIVKKASRVRCIPDFLIKLRAKAIFQKCSAYPSNDDLKFYYYDDDSVFVGRLNKGRRDGQGQQFWYSEQHYHGNFHDDKCEGQGRMYYSDGSLYDGEWKDNQWNGYGLLIQPNGGKLKGQWKMGRLHDDEGQYKWLNGWVYQGKFENGQKIGSGTLSKGQMSYEVEDIQLNSDLLDKKIIDYLKRKGKLNLSGESTINFELLQQN
ncbi:hypothetical protein pb186bvf_004508 [Paramecium bursaria]